MPLRSRVCLHPKALMRSDGQRGLLELSLQPCSSSVPLPVECFLVAVLWGRGVGDSSNLASASFCSAGVQVYANRVFGETSF